MRKFFAVAMGSVVALVGFAGAASASAAVDLIWIDVSNVGSNGNPICLRPLNRNCPQLGTTLNNVAESDSITLGVIITAGAGGVIGVGVSVDYSNVLPFFSVINFRELPTANPNAWLTTSIGVTSDMPPFIDNINALSLPNLGLGIGVPAGQTAYLGTVSFRLDQAGSGTFEIAVGAFGPGGTDGIGDLAHQNIASTTAFNGAFVTVPEPSALMALGAEIAMLAFLYRRRVGVDARRPSTVNRRPYFAL